MLRSHSLEEWRVYPVKIRLHTVNHILVRDKMLRINLSTDSVEYFTLKDKFYASCNLVISLVFPSIGNPVDFPHMGSDDIATPYHSFPSHHFVHNAADDVNFYYRLKGREGSLAQFILRCLSCCLWCLEKILKFINAHAYIVIGKISRSNLSVK